MKGMPYTFEFERKGVIELGNSNHTKSNSRDCVSGSLIFAGDCVKNNCCFVVDSPGESNSEPCSVLDRPLTSSSTLSSSGGGGGGGGGGDTARVAAVSGSPAAAKWQQDNTTATSSNAGEGGGRGGETELLRQVPPPLDGGASPEKCGLEEWDSVLSESGQEPLFRWIMADADDPSMATNLNKVFADFNGGSGGVGGGGDQFGFDPVSSSGEAFINHSVSMSPVSSFPANIPCFRQPPLFPAVSNNFPASSFNPSHFESTDLKSQIINPQFLINQHQSQHPQNPSFLMPFSYSRQEQSFLLPPPAKRHNPGGLFPEQVPPQLLQSYLQKPDIAGEETGDLLQQQQKQGIMDQLYKATELVQSGNTILAQGILARLNHQLSPIGKPFHRAAFYCKEALQLLINMNQTSSSSSSLQPFSLIFKIGAYKSFSEISPVSPFANFTCNQALLEAFEGFDRVHIVDFDIGYGGQWASLMQELALRGNRAPSLKITALASPSVHDELELGLTRENLIHFASEINMAFEFEILTIESLNSTSWSLPIHLQDNEAVAVNLPVSCFTTYQLSHPLVLRFVKQLMPKIVVSIDRACDRTDLLFPSHVIHTLQYNSSLLDSLDAVNVNFDTLQKIERFLVHPGIERIITGRYRCPEKTQHWRTIFLSSGFSPLSFSNFTESQAECVVKRTPVRGFHVEKRQSSLVLCWQRKELVSVSAWRC